jgi:hypothetical protein
MGFESRGRGRCGERDGEPGKELGEMEDGKRCPDDVY